MEGLLLFLFALVLIVLLSPVCMGYVAIFDFKKLGRYLQNIANACSQLGNVIIAPLANKILITEEGHKFGNKNEPISKVLGLNKIKGTFKKLGRWVDSFTNFFLGNNHTIIEATKN